MSTDLAAKQQKLARLGGLLIDEATVPGSSPDLIAKAIQLNPKLLGRQDQAEIVAEVERATSNRDRESSLDDAKVSKNDDLAKIVGASRDRVRSETERLLREEKRLQEERKQLTLRALEKVVDAVVTIDPNMVSPYTLMVLEDQKAFLRELGFDARKVMERRKAVQ